DASLENLIRSDDELPARDRYVSIMRAELDRGGFAGVRMEKRRRVAEIAARDLSGEIPLETVGSALADLTDACVIAALEEADATDEIAVISMGKLGGRELNYYSDIDLMFVATTDPASATPKAERLLKLLGDHTPQGQAFIVDTNLRPEGKSGALVRSLEGYLEYYRRWAKPWEFQALIKARPIMDGGQVGDEFMGETRTLVFSPDISEERVASVREMKARVEEQASRSSRRKGGDVDDVKLGPGGIRDIEFSIQLLQLVHGNNDASIRSGNTLDALSALVGGGYLAEDDAAGLGVAYRWLRNVEHRIQLWQERRLRHLPMADEDRSRLARVMGFKDTPSSSAADRFNSAHRAVLADVRNRFEKLFY
ncbi:MAG: hypothetical protein LC808_21390, partial [Actinobacteria bacterium]|nr:hypothetical protein [Actinomycetota bacterium]